METKVEAYKNISLLKDGGAVAYKCNGMYLLFEITQYGVSEYYEATYFENQINDLVDKAFSWS